MQNLRRDNRGGFIDSFLSWCCRSDDITINVSVTRLAMGLRIDLAIHAVGRCADGLTIALFIAGSTPIVRIVARGGMSVGRGLAGGDMLIQNML